MNERIAGWLRDKYDHYTIYGIGHYGCSTGYGPIYRSDIEEAYSELRSEIWDLLTEFAKDTGEESLLSLAARSRRNIETHRELEEWMVWSALELTAASMPEYENEPQD